MLTDQELMAMHVQTLFTHDAHARLLLVNEPGSGTPAPRLFLGRTQTGNLWRFRADLPESLIEALEALCMDEPVGMEFHCPPRHLEAYVRLLETHAPVHTLWMGPAYHFTAYPEPSRPLLALTATHAERLRGGFEELIAELPAWQPFLALVEEGRAVSVCRSVRITPAVHDAGVETLPAFRGRGYAQDVVAGWARVVQSLGGHALLQYLVGEYRLASGGEKTAPGPVRRRFSRHMSPEARGCLSVWLQGNERRPNIALEPTASSFGSAALRLRFRQRLTVGVRLLEASALAKGQGWSEEYIIRMSFGHGTANVFARRFLRHLTTEVNQAFPGAGRPVVHRVRDAAQALFDARSHALPDTQARFILGVCALVLAGYREVLGKAGDPQQAFAVVRDACYRTSQPLMHLLMRVLLWFIRDPVTWLSRKSLTALSRQRYGASMGFEDEVAPDRANPDCYPLCLPSVFRRARRATAHAHHLRVGPVLDGRARCVVASHSDGATYHDFDGSKALSFSPHTRYRESRKGGQETSSSDGSPLLRRRRRQGRKRYK